MSARPVKHSVTLKGHRTSVSLEDEFWAEFRAIAAQQGKPINVLVSEIDTKRGMETGLAGAIRLFVLHHLKAQAQGTAKAAEPKSVEVNMASDAPGEPDPNPTRPHRTE